MIDRAFTVIESIRAAADYDRIDDFLFDSTGDAPLSSRIVRELAGFLGSLSRLPHQGTLRPDIMANLRLLPFGKAVIAFSINEDARTVFVLRLFYGGEDIIAALGDPDDP